MRTYQWTVESLSVLSIKLGEKENQKRETLIKRDMALVASTTRKGRPVWPTNPHK